MTETHEQMIPPAPAAPHPTPGRIVMYVMPNGTTLRPAIVVVADGTSMICNMQVFTDGAHDQELMGDDEPQDIVWRAGVTYYEPTAGMRSGFFPHIKGTWHWPARA